MTDDDAEAGALTAREGIKPGMTDKQSEMNVLWTSILHAGLLLLLPVLLLLGAQILGVQGAQCETCDSRIGIASIVLVAGVLTVLAVSIGVSIILMVRRKPAIVIPIVSGFAMIACFVAAVAISGYPYG